MNYHFQNQTPILLYTVPELMEKIVERIEKERLRMEDALRLIVDTPMEEEMADVILMIEEKRKKERKRARKKRKTK